MRAWAIAVAAWACVALHSGAARAQDAFEIQVYDSGTLAPGADQLETHLNWIASGVREHSADGQLPTDRVGHLTLEPQFGACSWCEIGGYFQTALRPDGRLDFAGLKVRFKAALPARPVWLGARWGFALNAEIAAVPEAYAESPWGMEFRPIADVRAGWFYLALNPIVGVDFEGSLAGRAQFEPAAKVAARVSDGVRLGVEYYGAWGPLDAPLPLADQVHRLFAVVNVDRATRAARFDLELGVGYGLVAGERWIAKAIVGIEVGP